MFLGKIKSDSKAIYFFKHYFMEITMLVLLFISLCVSFIISRIPLFRDYIIDFGAMLAGKGLDREIWHERFLNGWFQKKIFGCWFGVLVIAEIYKAAMSADYLKIIRDFRDFKHNALLCKSTVAGTVMMIITHMFVYTNAIYVHDVVGGIGRGFSKYSSGSDKWAGSFLQFLSMGVSIPWLSGVLSILFMIGTVYFLSLTLGEDGWLSVFTISGLLSTNSSIITGHCFVGGEQVTVLTLFIICVALYFTVKYMDNIDNTIISVFLIALCTGIYGAFTPLYPSVLIGLLIVELLKGHKSIKELIMEGIRYLYTFMGGMVFYYICLKISQWYTGETAQSYMGEDNLNNASSLMSLFQYVPNAYAGIIKYFLGMDRYFPPFMRVIKVLLILTMIAILIFAVRDRWKYLKQDGRIILLLLLLIIWPLSINLIYVLAFGNVHALMVFVYVTPFLFLPKAFRWILSVKTSVRFINRFIIANTVILTFIFIYGGVVFANAVYIHLNSMYTQSLSIATRLIDRIEQCDGFTGNEKVVILGYINNDPYYGYSVLADNGVEILDADSIGSEEMSNGFTYPGTVSAFLKGVMNSGLDYEWVPGGILDEFVNGKSISDEELRFIEEMPIFPDKGGVSKYGDTIYVKFRES